jgi:2',3'-cyclic-nucleotide 2'-phosphodiesterase (5'-nucleotidase family)
MRMVKLRSLCDENNKANIAVIGIANKAVNDFDLCWRLPVDTIVHLYNTNVDIRNAEALIILTPGGLVTPITGAEVLQKGQTEASIPIHIIIGGEVNDLKSQRVGQTLFVQPGNIGQSIGIITLTIDRSAQQIKTESRFENFTESSPVDTNIVELMESFIAK